MDVTLPDYVDRIGIDSATTRRFFYRDSLPDRTVTLPYEGPSGRDYSLRGNLSGQSSYGTDSVLVSAVGYWRPDSL